MNFKRKKSTETVDVKIVKPNVAMWSKYVEARELTIKNYEEGLILEKAMLEMGKAKLKKAQ